jgi:hypothetical protein
LESHDYPKLTLNLSLGGCVTKEYLMPLASLNTGSRDGLDGTDETYPKPMDWFAANAMRFYFTNEQILAAALPDFNHPVDEFTYHTGIYFLIKNDEIVYVGQSKHIAARIWEHQGMRWDGVTWFEAPWRFLDDIETYYIRRILPKNNKKIPYYDGFDPLLPEELRVPKELKNPRPYRNHRLWPHRVDR